MNLPAVRVDVFTDDADATWLGCGSLVESRLVIFHKQADRYAPLPVICALTHAGGGEAITGTTLALLAEDGPAVAVGLNRPARVPTHQAGFPKGTSEDAWWEWVKVLARTSRCAHTPPVGDADDDDVRGLPVWCSWLPWAPGCR